MTSAPAPRFPVAAIVVVLAPALTAGGCAQQARLMTAPPESAHVMLAAPPFDGPPRRLVRYYGARQAAESIWFQKEAARLEVIYHVLADQAQSPAVLAEALEFPRRQARERLTGWRFNADQPITWAGQGTVRTSDSAAGPQTYRYLRYRLPEAGRECLGFEAEWDAPGYDPGFSPRKLLFGYYCAGPDQSLDDAQITTVLRSLRIRTQPTALERMPPVAGTGVTRHSAGPGTAAGHAAFPFRFRIVQGLIGGGDNDAD